MNQPIQVTFGVWTWVGPRNHVLDGSSHAKGQFWGRKGPAQDMPRHVWRLIYWKGLRRGQNQYGADADSCVLDGCTLAPSGKYDWTVCVRWQCSLMSNYFNQLNQLLLLIRPISLVSHIFRSLITLVMYLCWTVCNRCTINSFVMMKTMTTSTCNATILPKYSLVNSYTADSVCGCTWKLNEMSHAWWVFLKIIKN